MNHPLFFVTLFFSTKVAIVVGISSQSVLLSTGPSIPLACMLGRGDGVQVGNSVHPKYNMYSLHSLVLINSYSADTICQ